jgi:hypothetical protein
MLGARKKAGMTRPFCIDADTVRLSANRSGLLQPCGLRIPGDRAVCRRNRSNGGCQAQDREGGKDQVFHRNLHLWSGGMPGFDGLADGFALSQNNPGSTDWTYSSGRLMPTPFGTAGSRRYDGLRRSERLFPLDPLVLRLGAQGRGNA